MSALAGPNTPVTPRQLSVNTGLAMQQSTPTGALTRTKHKRPLKREYAVIWTYPRTSEKIATTPDRCGGTSTAFVFP
jgi:hypothetical protein